MKRFTALTAILALLLLTAFGASAATDGQMEIIHNQGTFATSTVVYGINQSYIIEVPDDVPLDPGDTVTSFVTLSEVYMPRAKTLSVTVASPNYIDDNWNVKLTTDQSVKIPYSLKIESTSVVNEGEILTCVGGDVDGTETVTLSFDVLADPVQSGSYLDTLTFTVSIIDTPNS